MVLRGCAVISKFIRCFGTNVLNCQPSLRRSDGNITHCLRQLCQFSSTTKLDRHKVFDETLVELQSDELYGLASKNSDLSDFGAKLEKGTLNLFPEYQRQYVWKPEKASRLIVTVLCSRFIPPVVLHEKTKGQFDVVDGKQRLTSLLGFYMNRKDAKLPGDPVIREKMTKILPNLKALSKLDESYKALDGLSFDHLSTDRQKAFESYGITYLVIPLKTPTTDVFEVYEDINSGGEDLTKQQIRRAVYHGPYMKAIGDLKDSCSDLHAIRDPKAYKSNSYEPCVKDSDGELVLRAFAFRKNGDRYKPPLKTFLNRELDGTADFDSRAEHEKQSINRMVRENQTEFEIVMKVARQVFGAKAFRKKRDNLSLTMWDAMYCAIAELLLAYKESDFIKAKDGMAAALDESIKAGFFLHDSERTDARKFIARRDEIKTIFTKTIRKVQNSRDNRRSFSPKIKEMLYERQGGLCGLCSQTMDSDRLHETNYVHIDHIKPHSEGGRTDDENAQLTHSECNLEKGAKSL